MMANLPLRFLLLAVVTGMTGMAMGLVMGIGQDFTLAPAHAHLNLLGWVSLSLYGLFYRAYPQATGGWLPQVHFAAAAAGVVVMVPGLALLLLGVSGTEPAVGIGALLSILGMVSFAAVVLRVAFPARAKTAAATT